MTRVISTPGSSLLGAADGPRLQMRWNGPASLRYFTARAADIVKVGDRRYALTHRALTKRRRQAPFFSVGDITRES